MTLIEQTTHISQLQVQITRSQKLIDKDRITKEFHFFTVNEDNYIDSFDLKKALLKKGNKIQNKDKLKKINYMIYDVSQHDN